ncbi:hypothetical protein ACHAWO_006659 [Cyclotella atomus]|uniref:Uncharacterized protein n=1 Tax=Cyclotella atomus TaxID=382360 RepID=A0ABD3QAA9_9STRA
MPVERGSDDQSASAAPAKPERQRSMRRGGISLDLSGDDSLFASDRKSEKDQPTIEKRSSVARDLEAADRIIDKKVANVRRQTVGSASRPKLQRMPTDEKSTRSDGYRRKQSISSSTVAKDLEAADRLIVRTKQRQRSNNRPSHDSASLPSPAKSSLQRQPSQRGSPRRPTWQSGEAKSNEMLQKLRERKSLSRSTVSKSDRHNVRAERHVSDNVDASSKSQGERAATALSRVSSSKSSRNLIAIDKSIKSPERSALSRSSRSRSSRDIIAIDKSAKSQRELGALNRSSRSKSDVNISVIDKSDKSQRERGTLSRSSVSKAERNASNSECRALAPFVSPVERMRRRRSSESLSVPVPTKTEDATSLERERSHSHILSSSGTNPQGANSNASLKKSISSSASGVSNAASESDFVPTKIRAKSNHKSDLNRSTRSGKSTGNEAKPSAKHDLVLAKVDKRGEAVEIGKAAQSSLSLKSKPLDSKPSKTNDLVLGSPYKREERDSQHARNSSRRSVKALSDDRKSHTLSRRSIKSKSQDQLSSVFDGDGNKAESAKIPSRRSKSLDVRNSTTSSNITEGSPRNSHGQSGREFDELAAHEEHIKAPRRRSRSASGDLRFSNTERKQPTDETSTFAEDVSFSTRNSTRHKFDMRETKHSYNRGRRRTVDRIQSERPQQNEYKEKMYRSKSDQSVARSVFRGDNYTEVTVNDKSSRRASHQDNIDESESMYIYETAMEDDPSMITDAASYDVRSRYSRRTYAKSVHSSGSSYHELTEVDEDQYDEHTDYIEDEETEYYEESCHDVPKQSCMSRIYELGERKGIKRKQCCCLLMLVAFSALAIFAALVYVVLHTITQPDGAGDKASDAEAAKANMQLSMDSDSPSTQPTIEDTVVQSVQLKPAPNDIEGRCAPSNFPGASSVCEAVCSSAKCCYAEFNEKENNQCFDTSADTPEGDANLLQCEGYRPYCDVLFNPWVQSFNGVLRPPAENLDQVCRNRLRRHSDNSYGRKLVSNECLKACLPSRCCSALSANDLSSDDVSLQSDGTVIDTASGDYLLTSCRDKNEDDCIKYEKHCDGVFERNDAMNTSPTRTPRATFPPAGSTVALPIAAMTPSPWFSKFSPSPVESDSSLYTPTFSVPSDNNDNSLPQQSGPAGGPRPSPSYLYPSPTSLSTPAFDSTSESGGDAATLPAIPSVPIDNQENSPSQQSGQADEQRPSSSYYYPSPPSLSTPTFDTTSQPGGDAVTLPTIPSDTNPSPVQNSPTEPGYSNPTYYPQSSPNDQEMQDITNPPASEMITPSESSLTSTSSSNASYVASAPPYRAIPEAPAEVIKESCSGDINMDKIMNGEKEACLNACREGLCCFIEEFQAAGLATTFEDVQSCYTNNELACYGYSSCLVMTLEKQETAATTSPSPTMLIPPPPFANPGGIFSSCSGPENFQLITNQDFEQNMKCLSACETGFCCYIDLFAKRGITAMDEDGNVVEVDSCWKGNEAICSGYEPCLVLTMEAKPSPPLVSPMTYRPVSEAPASSSPTPASPTRIPTHKPTDPVTFLIPSNPYC